LVLDAAECSGDAAGVVGGEGGCGGVAEPGHVAAAVQRGAVT